MSAPHPLHSFRCLHAGRRWEDFTFEERRELLNLLRDDCQALLPLLWEAIDRKPRASWKDGMSDAIDRLRVWDDFFDSTIPFSLKGLDLFIEELESLVATPCTVEYRQEMGRLLLGTFAHIAGVASGEWASLLEIELLSLHAARVEAASRAEVAAASRKLAEALADAAAARGDLDEEKRQRVAAQAAYRAEKRFRVEAQKRADTAEELARERKERLDKAETLLFKRRSDKAKTKPNRGKDNLTKTQWKKFLQGLDRLLSLDAGQPPSKRVGQTVVVMHAIRRHNEASETPIASSPLAVLKRWQRWRAEHPPTS